MNRISYSWYRFPPEVIQQTISCDLLQGRGRAPALRSRNREAVTLATGTIGRGEGQDEGLESDLLRGMIERLVTKPNAMAAFPNGAGISSATPQQKNPWMRWRGCRTSLLATSRTRMRSRIASWAQSGTQTWSARLRAIAEPA
jgi:hypothetical protein